MDCREDILCRFQWKLKKIELCNVTWNFRNRIRLGEWDLLSDEDCDSVGNCNDPPLDIRVESTVQHEEYDKYTLYNDIALIKLKEKVNFTEFVLPICLPIAESVKDQNTDSMNFTAVGWGNTEHGNDTYGNHQLGHS